MNLTILLGLVVAWAASCAGAFFYGENVGQNREQAGQAKIMKAIVDTREAAQQGAANVIAANKPINKTIVQKTQREITENVVYRDCRVTPVGVRLANEAITGKPAEPAGSGVVPSPRAAD